MQDKIDALKAAIANLAETIGDRIDALTAEVDAAVAALAAEGMPPDVPAAV